MRAGKARNYFLLRLCLKLCECPLQFPLLIRSFIALEKRLTRRGRAIARWIVERASTVSAERFCISPEALAWKKAVRDALARHVL